MFLLLIDANHIFDRAWKAHASDGKLSANAFYASCLSSIDRAIEENSPSHVLVCISDVSSSLRKDRSPEYRMGQWVLPESYRVQMFGFRQALKARGVAFTSYPGVESRDIISTVVNKLGGNTEVSVGILGNDEFLLPLVTGNTVMINHYAKFPDERVTRESDVLAKYGFSGQQVLDMLVLKGDAKNGIQGVPGVGPKKAKELISEYGSLAKLNNALTNLSPELGAKIDDFFRLNGRNAYTMWKNMEKLSLGFRFNDLKFSSAKNVEYAETSSPGAAQKIG